MHGKLKLAYHSLSVCEQKNFDLQAERDALQAELANERHLLEGVTKAMQSYRDELAALKAEQEWRGMESAPKDGTWFLAWNGESCMVLNQPADDYSVGEWNLADGEWIGHHVGHHPTHWQPLPTPPQEQSHED